MSVMTELVYICNFDQLLRELLYNSKNCCVDLLVVSKHFRILNVAVVANNGFILQHSLRPHVCIGGSG